MSGIHEGVKYILKFIAVALVITIIYTTISLAGTHCNNKFTITINNNELTARYDTEYIKYIFKRYGGSRYTKSISNDNNEDYFNKIARTKNYYLDIKEYEAYNRFDQRQSYEPFFNQKLKEIFNNKKTMMVQKDGRIIYEGEFKNDITDIISENGRYYFHVYVKEKESSSLFAYSKFSLHFCFLVGDNYE